MVLSPAARLAVVVMLVLGASACAKPEPPKVDENLLRGDVLLTQGKAQEAIAAYEKVAGPARDEAVLRLASTYEGIADYAKAESYLSEAAKSKPTDLTLRLGLARVTALRGDVRKAFAMAKSASEASPKSIEALLLVGALSTTADEVGYATQRLRDWHNDSTKRAANVLPSAETFLPLASLYERTNRAEDAAIARAEAKRIGIKDVGLALSLANVYFALERLRPAEELLLGATAAMPDRPSSWLRLAAVQIGLRKWQDAQAALARLPETMRKDPETVSLEARVLLGVGKPDEAEALLRTLLEATDATSPTRLARVHFLIANAAKARNDKAGAIRELTEAKRLDPARASAPLALAELHLAAGDVSAAIAELTALTAQLPDQAAAFQMLGQAHLSAGDAAAASRAFVRYAELAPRDPNGPLLEASALEAEGKHDEAEKQIERAIAMAPGSPVPLRQLVTSLGRRGRIADAENRVRTELARKGRTTELLTLLGEVLAAQVSSTPAKREAAEKSYREAITLDASNTSAWLALGNLYADTKDPVRAELMYGEALKQQPDFAEASLRLASLQLGQKDAKNAAKTLEAVLERHPAFVPALNNLAYIYSKHLSQGEKARALAERAVIAAPGSAHAADTLGWILHEQGAKERALPLLERAAKELPEAASVQYHYGMALLAAGQSEAGRATLERALALNADFDGATEARRALRKR